MDTPNATPSPRNPGGAKIILLYGLILSFLIPVLCFFAAALINGLDVVEAIQALLEQCSQKRQNPLLSAIPALLPLLLFALLIWARERRNPLMPSQRYAKAGLLAAALVQLWVNWDFWDLFLPHRQYPGFPHGLEFIIGPLFFSPVAIAAAVLIAALQTRRR